MRALAGYVSFSVRLTGFLEVRLSLVVRQLDVAVDGFGVEGGPQILNGLAKRVVFGSGHLGFELVERNAEIMGDVESGDKLPLVLEAGCGGLERGVGRQQRLEARGEVRIIGQARLEVGGARTGGGLVRGAAVYTLFMNACTAS